MATSPFIGMLMLVPYNFAPQGWMFCQGQLLPIAENDALFTLLGTTYGGDGQSTFGLPDLRGRVALHQGQGPGLQSYIIGQTGGVESVTLTTNQLPQHSHSAGCTSNGQASSNAGSSVLASGPTIYNTTNTAPGALAAASIAPVGGSQPHENHQPYLTLNWIISLFGVFPSQN
jgi:microcystin-dependent protein